MEQKQIQDKEWNKAFWLGYVGGVLVGITFTLVLIYS